MAKRKKSIQDIARQRLLQSHRKNAADGSNKFMQRETGKKNSGSSLPFTPFAPRDVKKPKRSDYGS